MEKYYIQKVTPIKRKMKFWLEKTNKKPKNISILVSSFPFNNTFEEFT